MLTQLTALEARIIGCLIEKSVLTPDQYPLSLNALVAACNQKSAREPVMQLTPGEAGHAVRGLIDKHHVVTGDQRGGRVERYAQRFCNSRYSRLQFDDAELAIVTLLLLRGPQTPGELRARSGRLHAFEDNAAVVAALTRLAERDPDPVVVKLPRLPGRKDSQYMHLFCGEVDVAAHVEAAAAAGSARGRGEGERVTTAELLQRIEALETEVARLRMQLEGDS